MSWELQANWPINAGQKVTADHFEDLRKLYWSIRFGYMGQPEEVDSYNPATEYFHGQPCMFEDYQYTFCPDTDDPLDPDSTIQGQSPAESALWIRTVRRHIYSDFNPSNKCYSVHWRSSQNAWVVYPAWQLMPAPLNRFVQRDYLDDAYDVQSRPLELKAGYDAETPVRFKRNYINEGWNVSSGVELYKQIVSGAIGSQYPSTHFLPGEPRLWSYFVLGGVPVGGDDYNDWKMAGYQSFIERLCEHAPQDWMMLTDEDYINEPRTWSADQTFQNGEFCFHPRTINGHTFERWSWQSASPDNQDNEPFAGSAHWNEVAISYNEKPNVASMRDQFWRCNMSAFELALRKLGAEHYDWYLDLNYPALVDQHDTRLGCWRRMWKHSHFWPSAAFSGGNLLVWASEWGDPPNNEETFETVSEARTFWSSSTNVSSVVAEVLSKQASEDMTEFIRRHAGRAREWYKSDDIPHREDYSEVTINGEDYWYADFYVLKDQLVNDMKAVLESLTLVGYNNMDGEYDFSTKQETWRREGDAVGMSPGSWNAENWFDTNWLDARDNGPPAEYYSESSGLRLGIANADGPTVGGREQQYPSFCDQDHKPWWARGPGYGNDHFISYLKLIDIDDDFLPKLDEAESMFVQLNVNPQNSGSNPPADTDTSVLDLPEMKTESALGIQIKTKSYALNTRQWAEVSYTDILDWVKLILDWEPVSDYTMWTKPPPPTECRDPDTFEGNYQCFSTMNCVCNLSVTGRIAVKYNPYSVELKNYLMDNPPCQT